MLDGLAAEDDGCIASGSSSKIFKQALALLEDAIDGVTFLGFGPLAQEREDRLKAFDLGGGLLPMLCQRLDQLRVVGRLDHLGQRFVDLLLGIIHIRQRMFEEISQTLRLAGLLGCLGGGRFGSDGLGALRTCFSAGFFGFPTCSFARFRRFFLCLGRRLVSSLFLFCHDQVLSRVLVG